MACDELEHLRTLTEEHTVGDAGQSVVWRTVGRGDPLVLLHGGHGSWLHWARSISTLSRTHRLLIPDMPGFGDSDPIADGSLDALLSRLLRSLNQLVDVQTPIDLAGFSFGGLVAAHLAGIRPVRRLALLGPAGHGGLRRPRAELRAWRPLANGRDAAELRTTMRHNLLAHMLHHEKNLDLLAIEIHTESCLRTRFHSKSISRAGGLSYALDLVSAPTLFVWGEHDVTVDPTTVEQTLNSRPVVSEIALVPGAGHWVQYEAAYAVNSLLHEWFQRSGTN